MALKLYNLPHFIPHKPLKTWQPQLNPITLPTIPILHYLDSFTVYPIITFPRFYPLTKTQN